MSWSIEVCGSKENVKAAIDEAAASSSGLPPAVAAYLKDAVDAIDLTMGTDPQQPSSDQVFVKSNGHRPMYTSGQEVCEVRRLRSGPYRPISSAG